MTMGIIFFADGGWMLFDTATGKQLEVGTDANTDKPLEGLQQRPEIFFAVEEEQMGQFSKVVKE